MLVEEESGCVGEWCGIAMLGKARAGFFGSWVFLLDTGHSLRLGFFGLASLLFLDLLLLSRNIAANIHNPPVAHSLAQHLHMAFLLHMELVILVTLLADLAEVEVGLQEVDILYKERGY